MCPHGNANPRRFYLSSKVLLDMIRYGPETAVWHDSFLHRWYPITTEWIQQCTLRCKQMSSVSLWLDVLIAISADKRWMRLLVGCDAEKPNKMLRCFGENCCLHHLSNTTQSPLWERPILRATVTVVCTTQIEARLFTRVCSLKVINWTSLNYDISVYYRDYFHSLGNKQSLLNNLYFG